MTFVHAKNTILKKFRDSIIITAFETNSGFVFSIRPKVWDDSEPILDAFFVVDKKNGTVREYSPLIDPEEFKYSIHNRVLYKNRS